MGQLRGEADAAIHVAKRERSVDGYGLLSKKLYVSIDVV
jgi:hypothetical protein